MADKLHSALIESERHPVKGASTATAGDLYRAAGPDDGGFVTLATALGLAGDANRFVVSDGAGGVTYKTIEQILGSDSEVATKVLVSNSEGGHEFITIGTLIGSANVPEGRILTTQASGDPIFEVNYQRTSKTFTGRLNCLTDEWMTADANWGINEREWVRSKGTGADPVLAYNDRPVAILPQGAILRKFRMEGYLSNGSEATNINVKLAILGTDTNEDPQPNLGLNYPTIVSTLTDIFTGQQTPNLQAPLATEIALDYTMPYLDAIRVYFKPSGTIAANCRFTFTATLVWDELV